MVFPVIHSTLDPKALTQELAQRYDLAEPLSCQLMSRANNDFYDVRAGEERYAPQGRQSGFSQPRCLRLRIRLCASPLFPGLQRPRALVCQGR